MFKSFIGVVFLIFGITHIGFAQKEAKFYGVVKDSVTLTPIANASIHNKSGKRSTFSNEDGMFQILANQGDTVYYYAPGYLDGFYIVAGAKYQSDTVEIWLRPKIRQDLPGVFVSTDTYKDYQRDSADRMKEFIEDVGLKTPTFSTSNSGAGLGIGLDALFGKKNKQKKKALEDFKENEKQRYVDFRFKPILVNHYSGLKGAKLQDFMRRYRPTYEWLRDNQDDDALKYYINDRLKLYFQRQKK